MKPTALVLNLFVAGVGTIRYARGGCFSWNILWPFAVLSVPFGFLGSMWRLGGLDSSPPNRQSQAYAPDDAANAGGSAGGRRTEAAVDQMNGSDRRRGFGIWSLEFLWCLESKA